MSRLTLILSGEDAEILKRLTEEGGFPSPEATITALLKDHGVSSEPELEAWLKDVGIARYDAYHADPARAVSIQDAKAKLLKDA
jgi:hypothetical protein